MFRILSAMAEYCFSRYLQATLYPLLVDHRHKCVLKELKSFLNKFVDQFFKKWKRHNRDDPRKPASRDHARP